MRDRYWHNMAARIQRAWRNYMRYKHECARRIQRFWKNNKESIEYARTRDYGHQVLAGRKERRRYSLLSYRRFMGDYLDINGKSALGEELQSACGISTSFSLHFTALFLNFFTAETVTFSSRIQILVSKLGRTSKLSPRFLILVSLIVFLYYDFLTSSMKTQKAIYIVINAAKDGQTAMTLERKIALVTIKSISMSTLMDDWMVCLLLASSHYCHNLRGRP